MANLTGKILLLVNTGTPDDPGEHAVRRYLSAFLNDPMVMDMPSFLRHILVNYIIVPFRTPHSSELYKRLWTQEGSPLRYIMEILVSKLKEKLGKEYTVIGTMRYGNPSLQTALAGIKETVEELTVLPLFPQYTMATTGSVKNLIDGELASWEKKPVLRFINQFYSDKSYISAFANIISEYDPKTFDHVLFSYHSLPVSHLKKIHPGIHPDNCSCRDDIPQYGLMCYKAACYETTRLLASSLKLDTGSYSTAFQSRFIGKWIGPYTDKTLEMLMENGKKRVLVAAPSFTTDCLETLIEINEDYRRSFEKKGGRLVMVRSLNSDDSWVDAIAGIVTAGA